MSQTKYPLPRTVRDEMIQYVRNYERRKKWYLEERDAIIRSFINHGERYYANFAQGDKWMWEECIAYQPRGAGVGNPTLDKALRLERLEGHGNVRINRAVEQAFISVGNDIESGRERDKVRQAVWDSCVEGRRFMAQYRCEELCVSKVTLYEMRRKFLWNIAKFLEII